MTTRQLLESLIAIPSLTPSDAGCLDILQNILNQANFHTQIQFRPTQHNALNRMTKHGIPQRSLVK